MPWQPFSPNQIPLLHAFSPFSLSISLCFWQYFNLKLSNHNCETYKVSIWTTDPLQVASFWQLMVPFHWRLKAADLIMLSQRPNLWDIFVKVFPTPSSRCRVQVMNDIAIGEKKNMNLPGVKVDLPVLQDFTWICWICVGWKGLMWMYIHIVIYYIYFHSQGVGSSTDCSCCIPHSFQHLKSQAVDHLYRFSSMLTLLDLPTGNWEASEISMKFQ